MQNIQKTRFLAANYSNLQGLKGVPLGMLLFLLILWANGQTGRATDLSLPILLAGAAALLTWFIFRYYQTRFGRTERTPRQIKMELIMGFAEALLGVGAFYLDTSTHLPLSLTGLVFAAAIAAEYLRMQWYAPGRYMLPLTLAAFTAMLVTSILPLLGLDGWWLALGLRAQLFGALAVAAIVMVLNGLVGHWFFMRQLPGESEKS